MLVDAMMTVAEAEALADWVALHNRNLETIYYNARPFRPLLRSGHSARSFPGRSGDSNAQDAERHADVFHSPSGALSPPLLSWASATRSWLHPEPYEHDTFTLEGHELRIIEQGHTDSADTTSLYVPSIGLIVAGDVVYNQCRMYVGDTTPESRKNWIAALDRLAALNPAIVVAGHKKPGAPDSPRRSKTPSVTCRTSIGCRKSRRPTGSCSIR